MTSYDILIAILLITSTLTSYFQGFIREMLSLSAWLIALLLMLSTWASVDQWLDFILPSSSARTALAGLSLFLITLILMTLLNTLLIDSMRYQQISVFESIFGILFGMARGSVFVVLFCILAGLTQLPRSQTWQHSQLLPVFLTTSDILHRQLAPDVALNIKPEPFSQIPD